MKHFRYPNVLPTVSEYHELPSLQPATLLLVGSKDRIDDPSKATARVTRLFPNIRAEVIADAGHGLTFDQAKRVNSSILELLRP